MSTDGKRMKITAVHYEGDSSHLETGRNTHEYQGEDEGRVNKMITKRNKLNFSWNKQEITK